jgi:hypothetical protein
MLAKAKILNTVLVWEGRLKPIRGMRVTNCMKSKRPKIKSIPYYSTKLRATSAEKPTMTKFLR